MKISRAFVVVFFVFVGFGYAQNKLTRKIMDYKNKPVVNARTYLDSIYSNVTTNSKGDFEVFLPEKVQLLMYTPINLVYYPLNLIMKM